jgi:hypothetical protein
MTSQPHNQEQLAAPGKIWITGLIAAVVATIGNLILYFITNALGVSFNIAPPGVPAPPFAIAVISATFIGVLLGTLVFSLMPRFTKRPITNFRTVAIIALVLSFIQPLFLLTGAMGPAPSIATILVLEVMHIVAGVSAIYFLTTRARA